MYRIYLLFLLLSILLAANYSYAQNKTYSILFYNVENLFDTIKDKQKSDNSFLPENEKYQWNTVKYLHKLNNISKVIANVNEYLPDIIGFAEVENRIVLEDLLQAELLKKANYQIVHFESSDMRGIDVALAYKKNRFEVIHQRNVTVRYNPKSKYKTRELLYVKGVTAFNDTLHLFVNHWKSRMGGVEKTEEKRIRYATIVKELCDSIMQADKNPHIIIMGDFNDNPDNKSINEILKAQKPQRKICNQSFYNLMYSYYEEGEGTLYYKSWELYDQMIVSGNLFCKKKGIQKPKAYIFKEEWLLYDNNGTLIPHSSYHKGKYISGYSDHLPVYIEFRVK
jgi:endonuclease/exonuclease/phosphatase family metal-dependent hydrolase